MSAAWLIGACRCAAGLAALCGALLAAACLTGCAQRAADRAQRIARGYVFYVDGAGGGGKIANYGRGVRQGLLDAGYDGAGENFRWQTGLGLPVDQIAANTYKRRQAARLAQRIVSFAREHPATPITLMGLSAGTAIATFALEQLPPSISVENVILLSGSLSSSYDLSRALQRVRGGFFVFTSDRDAVLQYLLPLGGTADRGSGTTHTIGVQGVRIPDTSQPTARELYLRKVVEVPHNPAFEAFGHYGGHTDTVRAAFVRHVIAPLVRSRSSATEVAAAEPAAGTTLSPDYARWARFAPGAWSLLEGFHHPAGGERVPLVMKATLMARSANYVMVQRQDVSQTSQRIAADLPSWLFVRAHADPAAHPLTHPASQRESLGQRTLIVDGEALLCDGVRVRAAAGAFDAWGSDVSGEVWTSPQVPGGIVRIQLETTAGGVSQQFELELRRYEIPVQVAQGQQAQGAAVRNSSPRRPPRRRRRGVRAPDRLPRSCLQPERA